MAERTEQLKRDIDWRREKISNTVDQVQNRVSPGRMMARGSYRVRRWLVDTKDQVMGNDEQYYPWEEEIRNRRGRREETMGDRMSETVTHAGQKASDLISEVGESISEGAGQAKDVISRAPEQIRRQTSGNPMAAGLIALGGGLLVGSLLPRSRVEHDLAQRVEPAISTAAEAAKDMGREVAEDLKDEARQAMDSVKETGAESARHIGDAREATQRVSDRGDS